MIEIRILDTSGQNVGSRQLDPAKLGGEIRYDLLKQAVVAHRANLRLGTAATKARNQVAGSTRKLYRQKGTGRARVGPNRAPQRRGGGRAHAKQPRDFSMRLPRQMRRLARNSAILAKALSDALLIVQGIRFDAPKTASMAKMLKAVGAPIGAVLATTGFDANLLLSARNIPSLAVKPVWELNAFEVLRARRLVFTPEAFDALMADPELVGRPAEAS